MTEEENPMKRIIALAMLLMLALLLAGCSASDPCELCGEVKSLSEVTAHGKTMQVCHNCELLVELGSEALGE